MMTIAGQKGRICLIWYGSSPIISDRWPPKHWRWCSSLETLFRRCTGALEWVILSEILKRIVKVVVALSYLYACMHGLPNHKLATPTLVQKRTGKLQTEQNRKGTESGLVLPSIAEESLLWITECNLVRFPNPLASGSWGTWLSATLMQSTRREGGKWQMCSYPSSESTLHKSRLLNFLIHHSS